MKSDPLHQIDQLDMEEAVALLVQYCHRERRGRVAAEATLEEKSRVLYGLNEELKRARDTLTDEVVRATAELSRSNERLQQNLDQKTRFVAQFSHDVRTPLNAILGMTELLADEQDEAKRREMMETIQMSGHRMMQLVRSNLEAARIEAGKLRLHPRPTPLRQSLATLARINELDARRQDIAFSVDIDNDLPERLLIDEGRYLQVVENLVVNALKFTSHGRVWIKVHADNASDFITEVGDTGPGIDKDRVPELFAAFERGNVGGGVGLGLSICKSLVDTMGGEIECLSQPGHGTRFVVTLPLVVAGQHSPLRALSGSAQPLPHHDFSDLAVLFADDSPVNRQVINQQLLRLGVSPTLVNDGQAAVDAVKARRWDLVILDLMMPVLGGEEALLQIRSLPARGNTHCVALTASYHERQRKRLSQLGFDDVAFKPLPIQRLQELLEDASTHAHEANLKTG